MASMRLLLPVACALALANASVGVAQTTVPAVTFMTSANTRGEEWPADFNRDGVTDLVSRTATGEVQIRIGNGNGTFRTPIVSPTRAVPLATGDLNGDRRIDIVAKGEEVRRLMVLPGNGNGTLGAPVIVADAAFLDFALVADLDGDGKRDLVTGWGTESSSSVDIFQGNGDFTFSSPSSIETGAEGPRDGFVADVNGDGLRDVLIVHRFSQMDGMRLLLNQGGLGFVVSAVPSGSGYTSDVTARDLDGDDDLDLLISGRDRHNDDLSYTSGYVLVALGNGDGTFTVGEEYPTGRGANSVVFGDFTHDGIVDVATLNHSYWRNVDFAGCGLRSQDANSLSILPGRGDGTFGLPTSFALNPQAVHDTLFDRPGNATLNTSDVNGDHFPDLIVGGGAILVTTAPKPNRPPVVSAGPDRPFLAPDVPVPSTALDPDGHFLSFSWTSAVGVFDVDNAPVACYRTDENGPFHGPRALQVTVSDGHDGAATDTVILDALADEPPTSELSLTPSGQIEAGVPHTIRWEVFDPTIRSFDLSFAMPATYTPIAECQHLPATARECTWNAPGPAGSFGMLVLRGTRDSGAAMTWALISVRGSTLPPGWESRDIGGVAAAGSASRSGDTFSVRGSGADIWGTSDEFHFAFRAVAGDFDVQVRANNFDDLHPWTKAGLMVRAGIGARAAHASVFLTSGNGIAFQTRPRARASTVHRGEAPGGPVAWLRLVRSGTEVQTFYRNFSTDQWTELGRATVELGDTVLLGFAVTSHVDGTLASATFDILAVTEGGLPPGVTSSSIGAVSATGDAAFDGTVFIVRGSGADIWGRADEFHFVSLPATGDFTIAARVASVDSINQWTKAGLMIREAASPGARHASVFVTPTSANGVVFQRRTSPGALSVHTAGPAIVAPVWVRLTRTGDSIAAAWRPSPSVEWMPIGTETLPGLSATVLVGLAVTSHHDGQLATATFDDVTGAVENAP